MKRCNSCGAEMDDTSIYCPQCGFRTDTVQEEAPSVYPEENTAASGAAEYPMKWHKFLTALMILGGILSSAYGIMYFTGSQYDRQGASADLVYRVYPGLKSCDGFMTLALVALGVFQFIVRSRLRKFRANGPGSLKVLHLLSIGVSVVYMLWASSATGLNMFTGSNLGSLTAAVVMFFVNSSYYAKRSDLFVN